MKGHHQTVEEIVISAFDKGYSYPAYEEIVEGLVEKNSSSGSAPSEKQAEYSRLNLRRMKRWGKTLKLSEETHVFLSQIAHPMNWLVLTESWCGDAAHLLPIFNKMAQITPMIDLRMVWRDEHPELMDLYLTQGSKSIPKLVAFSPSDHGEIATWGPRPEEAQQMVMDYKKNPERPYSELQKDLQVWYNRDKGQSSQREFLAALRQGL